MTTITYCIRVRQNVLKTKLINCADLFTRPPQMSETVISKGKFLFICIRAHNTQKYFMMYKCIISIRKKTIKISF